MSRVALIDEYLPTYDWVERHSLVVGAAPDVVYHALRSADLARSPVVRALLELRGLPAWIRRSIRNTPAGGNMSPKPARPDRVTLDSFREHGFVILDERQGDELVIGLIGRFWTLDGGLCATDANHFRKPLDPGTARAAWNFETISLNDRRATLLRTETRIQAADDTARRSFGRYWRVIRPFSGLIRTMMLRSIRAEAERS